MSGLVPLDTPESMNRTILENYGGVTSAITLALVVSGICIHILYQRFTTVEIKANDTITDLPST